MREGRGGHWNRAGRRSGGYRPREITAIRVDVPPQTCGACGNDVLPYYVNRECDQCIAVAREDAKQRQWFYCGHCGNTYQLRDKEVHQSACPEPKP
jgi:hypothetical protein